MASSFSFESLNQAQREAVGSLDGPVMLLAGAGTGKTRTVHRMLVEGQPDQVIVNDGTVPEVEADIHKRDITIQ